MGGVSQQRIVALLDAQGLLGLALVGKAKTHQGAVTGDHIELAVFNLTLVVDTRAIGLDHIVDRAISHIHEVEIALIVAYGGIATKDHWSGDIAVAQLSVDPTLGIILTVDAGNRAIIGGQHNAVLVKA